MSRFSKKIIILPLVSSFLLLAAAFLINHPAAALSGSDFNAGRIIDDAVFFNPNSMNPTDIQNFLNSKVPVCDTNGPQSYGGTSRAAYSASQGYYPPFTCLKDYYQTIPDKAADSYCGGNITGGNQSAAQIIYNVSQACSISPKVLLVLLQKEEN